MEVKTAKLKAHLSAYLRRVREEGASYVVLDRKTPVARLVPLDAEGRKSQREKAWLELRRQLEAKGIGIQPPRDPDGPDPRPSVAPDGRTDTRTIDLVRGGERDY